MIKVAEINDIERIDHFRLAWHELLGKTKGATFAHTPEWLERYWDAFGADLKLRTLIFTLGNKVIGIVPLVIKPVSTKLGLMRVLTYPLDSWGSFYGQIGQNPAATLVTAMRHIHNTPRDWDLIDLRYIDQDGFDHKRTANALKSVGYQGSDSPWQQLPITSTENLNWNTFLASRSLDLQQRIHSAKQISTAAGPVRFYRSRLEDPLAPGWNPRWDLWSEFEQMEFTFEKQTTIAGGNGTDSEKLAFLREIHGPAVRAGFARLDALFINHHMVACAYGLTHAQGVDYVAIGRHKNARPEVITALIAQMIQQSFLDEEPTLNFALASKQLARPWQNQLLTSYRCSHFPMTVPRTQVLRINRWLNQPPTKPSRTEWVASKDSALKLKLVSNQEPSIEVAAQAPAEWGNESSDESKKDRPHFRVIG